MPTSPLESLPTFDKRSAVWGTPALWTAMLTALDRCGVCCVRGVPATEAQVLQFAVGLGTLDLGIPETLSGPPVMALQHDPVKSAQAEREAYFTSGGFALGFRGQFTELPERGSVSDRMRRGRLLGRGADEGMGRLPRGVVPGLPHHVTQRGNRCHQTFFDEEDFGGYCRLLSVSCRSCGTQLLSYCLMPNYLDLILVPADELGLRDALAASHRRYTPMTNFREGWVDTFGRSGFIRSRWIGDTCAQPHGKWSGTPWVRGFVGRRRIGPGRALGHPHRRGRLPRDRGAASGPDPRPGRNCRRA